MTYSGSTKGNVYVTESTEALRCVLDHLKIFTLNDVEIRKKFSPDVLSLCSNLCTQRQQNA